MHPKARGEQSEAAVIHQLIKHGASVLEPFGDNKRYDLVVEESGDFYRIQVKTGRIENGRVQFETRSTGTLTREVKKEGYEGEIDVFGVHSPDLEKTYIVPIQDAPKTTMGLRYEKGEKSSPNVNRAENYQLSHWVEQIRSGK